MKKTTNYLFNTPFGVLALLVIVLLLSAFAVRTDALQDGTTSDTQVWIEFPLDGFQLPKETVTFVVYATASSGVSGIEVKINGETLPAGQLTDLSSNGSSLMVRLDQEWQAPAQGEYVLEASASGASASTTFCIETCEEPADDEASPTPTEATDVPTETPTETPTATLTETGTPTTSPTVTPSQTPTLTATATATAIPSDTPTPTPYTESSADFWAAPDYINQGECTTLNWNVYGDFQGAYFEGNAVNASGSDSECPAESYTYNLQVVEMDGSTTDYWTSVEVYVPPSDSTGPSINWTNLIFESCQFYGEAGIADPSGVAWAQFYYNKNGEGWNSVSMSELSTEYWQADYGVSVDDGLGTPIGSVEYYVVAGDSLGNQSESFVSVYNYVSCDG